MKASNTLMPRMEALLAKRGWFAQHVGAGGEPPASAWWNTEVDDDVMPAFTYTVGLSSLTYLQHPELIVVGPGYVTGYNAVSLLHDEIKSGKRLAVGDLIGAADGVSAVVMEVEDSTQSLLVANMIHRREGGTPPVEAFQLVLPDEQGRWPWQPGSGMRGVPLLGRIPDSVR